VKATKIKNIEDDHLMESNNLIWIDLEMTGLDAQVDRILEMATIITGNELNIVAEGPVLAIHQNESVLAGMDEWNQKQHAKSGLIKRVRASRIDEQAAERLTLQFVGQYVPKGKSPMCGNSICQDRRFLARCMPNLEAYFHYRNLDVSTVKELAQRWYPALPKMKKSSSHLALEDIRESIEELRYYRKHLFVRPETIKP